MSNEFEEFLKKYGDARNYFNQQIRNTYYNGFLPWFERYRNGDKSLDDRLAGMITNGLTEEETFFILAYTGSYSSWVNSDVRNGLKLECESKIAFTKWLNRSLDKVAPFNNSIVYRMDNPLGEIEIVLEWFDKKIGKNIKIPYFLSTAKEAYKDSRIVWKIETLVENSFGKDLVQLSNNRFEREVLFRTGSCFEIISTDYETGYINLKEIKSNSESQIELTGCYYNKN
ncbi:MAG: hypothetical protein IPO21_10630 [Bacteroidales bacterium]|nr:hypothetical protein [Bacteroidales bacterium]